MIRHAVLAVALCISALSTPVAAQETGTPAAFASAYVAAMQAADWGRVAGYMHPEALGQFKTMFGELSALDPSGQIFTVMFGVADSAAYAATPPDSIFGSFIRVIAQNTAAFAEALTGSTMEAIGTVDEAKTGVTHFVYRMHTEVRGLSVNKLQVMPLKQHEGQWRLLLSGDIEGMATAMKLQLMQQGR